MKKTQKEIVLNRLERYGQINNFWAFHNYILRLGDIIYRLRKEGYNITGSFGTGKNKKNFYYFLNE